MAKSKSSAKSEFASFDIHYADGSQTSNRKIPKTEISQFERDESLMAFFQAQDREIEERSGRKRAAIATIKASEGR